MDRVFHNASQESIYEHCAREVTSKLMEGFNGTIFAYGETGAGKTYTMMGPRDNYRLRGIIPRAISQVCDELRSYNKLLVHRVKKYIKTACLP